MCSRMLVCIFTHTYCRSADISLSSLDVMHCGNHTFVLREACACSCRWSLTQDTVFSWKKSELDTSLIWSFHVTLKDISQLNLIHFFKLTWHGTCCTKLLKKTEVMNKMSEHLCRFLLHWWRGFGLFLLWTISIQPQQTKLTLNPNNTFLTNV